MGNGKSEGLRKALASSKTAYRDFLVLWKDADPDIPILKASQGRVRETAVSGNKLLGWRFC